jgi:hypothetical protein
MADRFPSLDELSGGQHLNNCVLRSKNLTFSSGQTESLGTSSTIEAADAGDFLARERAALGDDANQFASPNDHITVSATVEDEDDDLLGGDFQQDNDAADVMRGFESSYPAIESQNEVRLTC